MKKIFFIGLSCLLLVLTVEFLSAEFLFFWQKRWGEKNIWAPQSEKILAYQESVLPLASASLWRTFHDKFLKDKKTKEINQPSRPYSDSASIFLRKHDLLGWAPLPGHYQFNFSLAPSQSNVGFQYHDWEVTIEDDLSRKTGFLGEKPRQTIYLFGESWTFGWSLDDNLTAAWHLQTRLVHQQTKVKLFANGGWGHLQALRNFEKLSKTADLKKDIFIFSYAQWMLPRNLPNPAVVRTFSSYNNDNWYQKTPFVIPSFYGEGGMFAAVLKPNEWRSASSKPEPTLEHLFSITEEIFDYLGQRIQGKKALLLLDGPKDPLVEKLESKGWEVWDARPHGGLYQKDTMLPFDAHPGPIANQYWAEVMHKKIMENRHQP